MNRRLWSFLAAALLAIVAVLCAWPILEAPRYTATGSIDLINEFGDSPNKEQIEELGSAIYSPESVGRWLTVWDHSDLLPNAGDLRWKAEFGRLEFSSTTDKPDTSWSLVRLAQDMAEERFTHSRLSDVRTLSNVTFDTPLPGAGLRLLGSLAALVAAVAAGIVAVCRPPRRWTAPGLAGMAVLLGAAPALPPTVWVGAGLAAAGVACLVLVTGTSGLLATTALALTTRGGTFDQLVPGTVWAGLTVAPLLGLGLLQLSRLRHRSSRTVARFAVLAGALAAWAAASSLWSMVGTRASLSQAVVLVAFLGAVIVLAHGRWGDQDTFIRDLGTITLAITVPMLLGVVTMRWQRWQYQPEMMRFQGFTYNPNALGNLLAVLLVAEAVVGMARWGSLTTTWRLVLLALAGAQTVGLVMTGARGALLGLLVGVGLLVSMIGWRKLPRALRWGSLVTALALGVLGWSRGVFRRAGGVTAGRGDLWSEAWGYILRRPLHGWGYRSGIDERMSGTYHSIYLTLGKELGLVGLCLFLALVVVVLLRSRRVRFSWAPVIVTILVVGFFDSSMLGFFGATALPFWMMLAGEAAREDDLADGGLEERGQRGEDPAPVQ